MARGAGRVGVHSLRGVAPPRAVCTRHQQAAHPALHHRRAQPGADDRREADAEAQGGHRQRPQHPRVHGRRAGQGDAGRLVQGVPPLHAELDDRQVDHADEGEDRAGAVAALRIVERAHQGDVPEVEEEQHQHRGQARVPHPPRAPHRLAPQRAGGQAQRGDARAHRPDLHRGEVGQRVAPDQRDERARRERRIPGRGQPRRRHVDVHDAHGVALLPVGRREEQAPAQPGQRQRQAGAAQPGLHPAAEAQEPAGVGEPVQPVPGAGGCVREGRACVHFAYL